MIAWERYIDASRDDDASLYRRLCAPVTFSDGAKAAYGFGLARSSEYGRAFTGHGGALRGWRSHRLYAPADRLSIVVMFNHLSDAHKAAIDLLGAALGEEVPAPAPHQPEPGWLGAYLEPQTGLSVRVDSFGPGAVRVRYGHSAERLALQADGTARNASVQLRMTPDGLFMDRASEQPKLKTDALRRVFHDGCRRALSLRRAWSRTHAGRRRRRHLRRILRRSWPGKNGAADNDRSGRLGSSLPPRARPHAAWRLDVGDHARLGRRQVCVEVGCWLARGLTYRRIL